MLEIDDFQDILSDLQSGKPIVLLDDALRENEGDVVVITELLLPEHLTFFSTHARGLICVSISDEVAQKLDLPYQVSNNFSPYGTPFTVSVDYREVKKSGVLPASRVITMKKLLEDSSKAEDFTVPGHVFPLIAHPAGVFGRQGQTEGSYDLARILGYKPSGVICEILAPDGSIARGNTLNEFVKKHQLRVTTVEEIIRYRIKNDNSIRMTARSRVTTDLGEKEAIVFVDDCEKKEHIGLIFGDINNKDKELLIRIHSECLTGDVFGSRRCDCGEQLKKSIEVIQKHGNGMVIYLRQEGRGIGLLNKLKAYNLQDRGQDTVEANLSLGFAIDSRDFVVAATLLKLLGILEVSVLTNNPQKCDTLVRCGINVKERIPIIVPFDEYSKEYLHTKKTKLGHMITE
jgi:3,4-dihydroxy 2-butanone 4-phosphate synthase / GTP cyclohydrolase II